MNNKTLRHSIAIKLLVSIILISVPIALVITGIQLYFGYPRWWDDVWMALISDGIQVVLTAVVIYFIAKRLITRYLNEQPQLSRPQLSRQQLSRSNSIEQNTQQEEQSHLPQKLNASKKVSADIAHDYNNLLGIIKGYAEQLNNHLSDEPKLAKYAQEILHAAERVTKLNEKLLSGSHSDAQTTVAQNDQFTPPLSPPADTEFNPHCGETLLVVDDEPSLATMAREMLSSQGYRVLTANSGEQALEILEKETIALMVSDVVMPQMDGYQLAATVQQQYPHIKILMVSGINDRHNSVTGDLPPANMLLKPYELKTLLERVRNLLDDKYSQKNFDHCSILVMDDEEDVRELFSLKLAKLGCKTIPASNGEQAIELYRKSLDDGRCIDAIIMDLSIPGGQNGKDVADKIRTLDPDARIIVASGHSDSDEMTHYQNYGFQGALEKDFDQIKIKQVLKHVLSIN